MELKLDDDGHVVVRNGKPVYVEEGGKEIEFDAVATVATISRLNGEAKSHREAKQAAEKALEGFQGIDDPEAAIKALNTMKNLDDKKLVDAGEIEKVKAEVAKAYEEKLAAADGNVKKLEQTLNNEMIGGAFGRSSFIKEKIAVPPDMVQATFGSAFKIEDGKVVATDKHGNPIYSKSNPGEIASFDEALETLVDHYAHRDSILVGANNGGGGTRNGSPGSGSRVVTRAQLDAMSPREQQKMAAAARNGEVKLTD